MLQIDIITVFPEYFDSLLSLGVPARAEKDGLARYRTVNLRDFTRDKHRTVDDYPFGGGSGMVLKPEPVFESVEWCRKTVEPALPDESVRVVLLSARGKVFDQEQAKKLSLAGQLILICGHYKDVDERVAKHLADEELSIGDYVLSGGEPAAAVVVDAVARLIPGSLGDFQSAIGDSFFEEILGAPQYTRPQEYRGYKVPEVLTSGDHERIERWRKELAERLTAERRPDLLK
ncbi:tRNA (guanosine(37)-N1)-methyltransferase TrmD [Gemmatimonadota bacterium]